MIVIKGKNAVIEALQSENKVKQIIIAQGSEHSPECKQIKQLASQFGVSVSIMPSIQFKTQFPDQHAQQVVATMEELSHTPLEAILKKPEEFPIIVVLDHLEDPHNMGAIARTCAGLGVKAMLYPKDRQAPISSGTIKASAGGIYHINLVKITNVADTLLKLRDAGYWIFGTDSETGEALPRVKPQFPCALVVGNEGSGISHRVLKMVDLNVRIPMSGRMESLNVSVATGIILYSFCQQYDSI